MKKVFLLSSTYLFIIGLLVNLISESFAQSRPKPVKVLYEISDTSFVETKCREEKVFNYYKLYLPKELKFQTQTESDSVKINHYKNDDKTIFLLLSETRIPNVKLLSHYNVNSQYEFDKKVLYSELSNFADPSDKNMVKIEDISAKDWHGFLKLRYIEAEDRYIYQYWVFNYDNNKYTEVDFVISDNYLTEGRIKDIMASFSFLN